MRGRDPLSMLGACRFSFVEDHEGKDLFFPWDTEESIKDRLRMVHDTIDRYCAGCPVRRACFDAAMETASEGVWGGVIVTRRNKNTLRRRWREGEYPETVITGDRKETTDEDEQLLHVL